MDINSAVVAVESAFGFMIDELEGCSNFDKESIEREKRDVIALLKEQNSILGIHQTADGITFISTGDARQGEERGLLFGKKYMHEHLFKELLYKGLMTDDIRTVFENAERW